MILNLYPVFFTFLIGLGFGLTFQWLWNNNHRRFIIFIFSIIAGWLIVQGIESIFTSDTLLRQTYSELQGWADFVFGFTGWMLGCYLEDRYEQNRKFKIIVHIPRQATAYVHAENPRMFGVIRIVPERYKERKNEQFVMGGLPKIVLDRFLGRPRNEQVLLINSTVKAVGELRLFQHKIANITSLLELVDELQGLNDTAAKYVKKEGHGGYDERFQLWLGEAKLSLIQVRLEELSKMPKNRTG